MISFYLVNGMMDSNVLLAKLSCLESEAITNNITTAYLYGLTHILNLQMSNVKVKDIRDEYIGTFQADTR
jgi:Na+-translocating ferredoxin:NAD+ oxidoreductase RnfE subunit